jgi:hypothetical protein
MASDLLDRSRGFLLAAAGALLLCACHGDTAPQGSCAAAVDTDGGGEVWTCTSHLEDASRALPSCGGPVSAGASCDGDVTMGTTNPTGPAQIMNEPSPECFECAGGTGTDWTCGPSGWQAAGTFACAAPACIPSGQACGAPGCCSGACNTSFAIDGSTGSVVSQCQ